MLKLCRVTGHPGHMRPAACNPKGCATDRLPIWKYAASFYPAKIVKTAELDPDGNYIFGAHPHGIFCSSLFLAFSTEALDFSKLFPGVAFLVAMQALLAGNHVAYCTHLGALCLSCGRGQRHAPMAPWHGNSIKPTSVCLSGNIGLVLQLLRHRRALPDSAGALQKPLRAGLDPAARHAGHQSGDVQTHPDWVRAFQTLWPCWQGDSERRPIRIAAKTLTYFDVTVLFSSCACAMLPS